MARTVFDVDDAIWLHQRWGSIDRLARWARHVVCGNSFIAERFEPIARTWVLSNRNQTTRFRPIDRTEPPSTIVWSGSRSGHAYLQSIEPALRRVLRARPDVRLRIVSDARPDLRSLNADQVEYVGWSTEIEVSALQSAAVGVMPMADEDWSRGKCSFKMLTYMACGLPVVVSPYGMNADLLNRASIGLGAETTDQWTGALLALVDDGDLAQRCGRAGRALVESTFTVERVAAQLASVLRTIAAE